MNFLLCPPPTQVHGACGIWGCLAVGLFTAKEYSYAPHKDSQLYKDNGGYDAGLFMEGTYGMLFATQLVAVILEILWVCTLSGIMFGLLKILGIFRVPQVPRATLRPSTSPFSA